MDERHDADVRVRLAELRRAGQQLRRDLRRDRVDVHGAERRRRQDHSRRRDRDEPERCKLGNVRTDRSSDDGRDDPAAADDRAPAGAIKEANGLTSIPASSVTATDRLVIDSVKFTPGRLTSRAAFSGRFHVAEANGYVVRDALVKVTPLPYSWAKSTHRGAHRRERLGDVDDHADDQPAVRTTTRSSCSSAHASRASRSSPAARRRRLVQVTIR